MFSLLARLLVAQPSAAAAEASTAPGAERRAVPDYDGRIASVPSARESLLWVPRALLLPAHLAAEYGVRRPTNAFLRWGDQHRVFRRVYDLLTWDDGRSAVYPTASLDLGVKSTVGAALVERPPAFPLHTARLAVSASTQGVLVLGAQDQRQAFRDTTGAFRLGGQLVRRPDGVFYGIGPDTATADKTYYTYDLRGVTLGMAGNLGGLSHATVELGYRDTHFRGSQISPDTPSLDARYGGPGQTALPPGWGGYDLAWSRAALTLDSRSPSFESPATGVRVDLAGSYAQSPGEPELRLWGWGVEAGAFYDVSGFHHVIALEAAAHFVEQAGSREIPFTELPSLGGTQWMRGFLGGRLRGPSTLAVTLQYRYPVWSFLEGELFSSLGNAFLGHLAGARPARLFLDWGLALRTTFSRDAAFTLTVAFASNRLDSPRFDAVDGIRVALGVMHGF